MILLYNIFFVITFIIIDIKVKITILNEIKDTIETIQAVEYSRFLNLFIPIFFSILTQTQPSFINGHPHQVNKIEKIYLYILVFYY